MKLSSKIILIIYSSFIFFLASVVLMKNEIYIIFSNLAVFYITLMSIYYIFKRTDDKLKGLKEKIENITKGDISANIKSTGKDEVGKLGESVNNLIKKIQTDVALDLSKNKEIASAKSDFVSLASHQLRTPLSIIKWYIDYIASGDAGSLNPEQKRFLNEAYKSNERMIELVNNLLLVSRIDLNAFMISPEPADLAKLVDEVVDSFSKDLDARNLTIKKQIIEMDKIKIDPVLTKLVFENILSNSIKYVPDGDEIIVDISKDSKDLFIKIIDKGLGIPEEQQPQIFSKLFRADNVKKIESVGTGLGLYIVKAVIENSGGSVWFKSPSNLNKKGVINKEFPGTTFYIKIPLTGMKEKEGTKSLRV